MKKVFMIVAVMGTVAFTACSEEAKVSGKFILDNAASMVLWQGQNRDDAGHMHEGTIKLKGDITVKDGAIAGAFIGADLESIEVTDLADNPEKAAYLKGHLMNQDFFAAEDTTLPAQNPMFNVESVENGMAKGTLTMRGMDVAVSIPVIVEITAEEVKVTSDEFTVDFLPFSMPFFAQDKVAESEDDHVTILKGEVTFKGLNIVAKKG